MNIWIVIALYATASILGDVILYWIARIFRRDVFAWKLFRKPAIHNRIERMEAFMQHHPIGMMIWSRFIGITATVVNLLAGLSDFSFPKFLCIDIITQIVVAIIFAFIGFIFGDNWIYIAPILQKLGTAIIIIISLVLIWRFFLKARSKK